MATFNLQHIVIFILLILVILLAFNKIALANPEPSAGDGGCQHYVPNINDECPNQEFRLEYPPVLSPNSTNNSKPSKRFQICNDGEGIGKNGNANAFTCTNDGKNRQINFHGTSRGNSKEDFKNAMKDGALLADYLGIWILGIDFELKQNWQSIVQSGSCELKCQNNEFKLAMKMLPTTEMPTTMSPEELALYSKCKCSWEPLEKAVLKINNGTGFAPIIYYTLRVGYIEKSTNQLFEKFVKNFVVDYENFIEIGDIPNVRGWINVNSDWIHDLPYNEFRYVPLPESVTEDTKMMFCVFRCPSFDGAFAIAPAIFDEKLAGKWEISHIKHNWTNDFPYIYYCKKIDIETNWQTLKFAEQEEMDGPPKDSIYMSFGISFKEKDQMFLTAAQIEAHKYRFGYTRPLLKPEYNQTANDYKLVRYYGAFFAPRDYAYNRTLIYLIDVNYRKLRYSALVESRFASENEESKQFWNDQIVTFFIRQENIVCPDFNVTFPRINVFARVYVDDTPFDYPFQMNVLGLFNERGEYMGAMRLEDVSEYELYKKLTKFHG